MRWSSAVVSVSTLGETQAAAERIAAPSASSITVRGARASFVADPMLAYEHGRWYMFTEVLDIDCGRGIIAVAEAVDTAPPPAHIVDGLLFNDTYVPGSPRSAAATGSAGWPRASRTGPGLRSAWAKRDVRGPFSAAGSVAARKVKPGGELRFGPSVATLWDATHMSFPVVFPDAESGLWYMMPETYSSMELRLYGTTRAAFPHGWTVHRVLLTGIAVVDTVLLRRDDAVFLFTTELGCTSLPHERLASPRSLHGEACPAGVTGLARLRVYVFPDGLLGDFVEHPMSPLENTVGVRVAGRPIVEDFEDASSPVYLPLQHGANTVTLRRIEELSRDRVVLEEPADAAHRPPLVTSMQQWWGRNGMHTADAVRVTSGDWIVAVDGYVTTRGLPL